MGMATHRPPIALAADPDEHRAMAKSTAFYVLTMLVQDTKTLVEKAVSKTLKEGLNSATSRIRQHAKQKSEALLKWNKSNVPLAWNAPTSASQGGYALLLIILNDNINNRLNQLTHSKDEWSYEQVADHLVKMAISSNPTIS